MASSRTATIGFGIGLALVAVLGVLAVRSAREAMTAVASVERSHAVIEAVDATAARLGEAKSLRRAYGVTGNAGYKRDYRDALDALDASLATIRTLASDAPAQAIWLAEVVPMFEARVGRLEQQMAKRDALGKDIPLDDSQSAANGRLDDTIRRVTSEMISQERDELAAREASSARTFATAEIVDAASAICALGALVLAFAIVKREIRERRRAEAETAIALQASEALNHELEAFSYSVSHDLRGPLRAIDGFSLAVLEDNGDKLDAEGKGHLARVRTATQRMGLLIDDLLELSRVTRAPMQLESVDLSAMTATVIAELREAEPARDVAVTIAPALATRGDPRLVRVLLDNLLGNAFKFTGKRERATIEVGATAGAFFVRDNGAGFDPTYAEKLFGAFQRLHDAREFAGTGIGLATVQRIVRRHGGRVWATGEPGKGATFSFTLG
ncbi:MAG TPA: ATP-binding protein [Kofleriaceae bacterium]|nr:ATP-binding protein [Kofleriaceae bacterium]